MGVHPLLTQVLGDEALTRGLGDEEARVLIEWLVERAEAAAQDGPAEKAEQEVRRWCRRGRGWARFVALWSVPRSRGAALQLAAAERFNWPLPEGPIDPCQLMEHILDWEGREHEERTAA